MLAEIGAFDPIEKKELLERIDRLKAMMAERGIDFAVIMQNVDLFYFTGTTQKVFRKPYAVAREIVEDAMGFGREGINGTELFQRAFRIVKQAHLEDHFMGHGEGQVTFIGHGMGLEINEQPVITARHSRILQEGMVFAFEPKFVFPGIGAIGIEVDFIVRRDRLERITETPIDIVSL